MNIDPALIDRVRKGFVERYGRSPDLIAHAPGRVNLIGEHTDYNDGFVLPCAIPYGTMVALARRADSIVDAVALDLDRATDSFDLTAAPDRLADGHWANHLRGVAMALPHFGMTATGADIAIAGNVPKGAGLSSSASLGVALGLGLSTLGGQETPDRIALARAAQWSEHHYVGCACGIMDQLASACSSDGHALLIDCRNNDCQPVALPPDVAIVIVHSGVVRGLVDSAYNERRAQCEAAARHYGVAALRDLDPTGLEAGRAGLDEISYRRARHVVTENARTIEAADALRAGDLARLGDLMRASHASLRKDFEVTVPQVNALADAMNAIIGPAGGARMTGGGFGGCLVAILSASRVEVLKHAIRAHWDQNSIEHQLLIAVRPSAGATLL